MSEKKMMRIEDFRMLNDYLKTLTHAQSNGVKVGSEIQQVVRKINDGMGLNVKRHRSTYKNANDENVVTEWTQVGDEVSDINQIKLNQVSTKHLYNELLNRENVNEVAITGEDGWVKIANQHNDLSATYNHEHRGRSRVLIYKD